ncbi:hypothetical protein HNQ50_003048 [Silvimonas terrae]|uniref:Uncharacterized protein n=1 Tax=Silvimonas terrae TaxID=300266 RepID=A0A840RGX4_9NEIS|nr:hypothetical protein [Silvimonas terrae]
MKSVATGQRESGVVPSGQKLFCFATPDSRPFGPASGLREPGVRKKKGCQRASFFVCGKTRLRTAARHTARWGRWLPSHVRRRDSPSYRSPDEAQRESGVAPAEQKLFCFAIPDSRPFGPPSGLREQACEKKGMPTGILFCLRQDQTQNSRSAYSAVGSVASQPCSP